MEYNPPKHTKGNFCPALMNENYDYHLSGDCQEFCICSVTNTPCLARTIKDPDDQSSQFFSRGRIIMDSVKANKCPVFGVSKETFASIIKDKMEKEMKEKLDNLNQNFYK